MKFRRLLAYRTVLLRLSRLRKSACNRCTFMITMKSKIIRYDPSGSISTLNAVQFGRLARVVLSGDWEATPNPDPERVRALAVVLGTTIVVVRKVRSVGRDFPWLR
jgi:hypothetical protein